MEVPSNQSYTNPYGPLAIMPDGGGIGNPCPEVHDDDITIGGTEILKRGANDLIFRTYKPIQIIEYYGKSRGWVVVTDMRTNAQARGAADGNWFTLMVNDAQKKEKYRERIPVATKVMGRLRASLIVLTKIFGKDYNWLKLVKET